MTDPEASGPPTDHGATPGARRLVTLVLVLLLVPGIIGFEAWPLSAWRLFSLSRDDRQTRWVLDAADADGDVERVSLEQLPLRYRNAEWPMAELPGADDDQREAVCQALLEAVVAAVPGTVELRVVRDRQQLVAAGDAFEVRSEPEVVHACGLDGSGEGGGS